MDEAKLMKYYFYIIHFFQPNVVSLQLPVYMGAVDAIAATAAASALKSAIASQFQLAFEPSDPVLLVPSVNGPYFDYFFSNLNNGNQVTINLPINFNGNVFQCINKGKPLAAVNALVTIPGNHPNFYSL